MGFFDFVKKIGKSVWNGVKKVGKFVADTGDKIKGGIGKAYNFVKGIPVIGNMVEDALDKPVFEGMSVRNIAGAVDGKFQQFKGVNKALQNDDVIGAGMKAYQMSQGMPSSMGNGIRKIKGRFS